MKFKLPIFLLAALLASSAIAQTYTPLTDTNTITWFKADDLSLSNGEPVSVWNPAVGSTNFTLQQLNVTNQPTFESSALNGLPAVFFNGSAQFLTNISSITSPQSAPYTVYLVYKYTGSLGAFKSYYCGNTLGKSSWFIGCYQTRTKAGTGTNLFDINKVDPHWHLISLTVNGTNSAYSFDGNAQVSGNAGPTAINSLELGGVDGSSTPGTVHIGEFLIYKGDQLTGNTSITQYLDERWGVVQINRRPTFSFRHTDRRPIGKDFLSASASRNVNNPRGYLSSGAVDITSSNSLISFRSNLLSRASNEVAVLYAAQAQGVIIWDIEGCEIGGLNYVGDPTKIPLMAPEMNAVADDFFKVFTDAGLRVGVCIRPQSFSVGTNFPSGTNGDIFVKMDEPYLQREHYYTNGWVCVTNYGAPVYETAYQPGLLDKITYAKNRWGCSLFYIDSYGLLDSFGPVSVTTLKNIAQTYPDVVLAPELAYPITAYDAAVSLFGMTAPYLAMNYTGYFVPTNVTIVYPYAASVLSISTGYTNSTSIVQSMQAGNMLLFNSWYTNSTVIQLGEAANIISSLYKNEGETIQPSYTIKIGN